MTPDRAAQIAWVKEERRTAGSVRRADILDALAATLEADAKEIERLKAAARALVEKLPSMRWVGALPYDTELTALVALLEGK